MYFRDLTPYSYSSDLNTEGRLVNFGWLARGKPFQTGSLELDWLNKLGDAVVNYVNAYRGTHDCEFCSTSADFLMVTIHGRACLLGHAEAWVPAADGRIFVAPTLVYHYVIAHQYRPPDAVVDALRALPEDPLIWNTPDGLYRRLVAEL